jgi:hypothetical protein
VSWWRKPGTAALTWAGANGEGRVVVSGSRVATSTAPSKVNRRLMTSVERVVAAEA